MSRAKLDEEVRRSATLSARVTEAEKKEVEAVAAASGLAPSEIIRRGVLLALVATGMRGLDANPASVVRG
ncbi:MAG: hypothetical protein FJX75_15540 [Armatimonadetes bacterium]|nr:hypothetical protein [Armatimonadota bacterium]